MIGYEILKRLSHCKQGRGEVHHFAKHYIKDITTWPGEYFVKPLSVNKSSFANDCILHSLIFTKHPIFWTAVVLVRPQTRSKFIKKGQFVFPNSQGQYVSYQSSGKTCPQKHIQKGYCALLTLADCIRSIMLCEYLGYWCGCSWVSERSWPEGCVAVLSAAVVDAPRPAAPSSSLVAPQLPVCPAAAPEPPPEPPLLLELQPPALRPQSDQPRPQLANGPYQPPAAAGLPPLLTGHHREGENEKLQVKQAPTQLNKYCKNRRTNQNPQPAIECCDESLRGIQEVDPMWWESSLIQNSHLSWSSGW